MSSNPFAAFLIESLLYAIRYLFYFVNINEKIHFTSQLLFMIQIVHDVFVLEYQLLEDLGKVLSAV